METVDELRRGFADPPPEARPMMRWWWFGPAVERTELDRELTAMAAAGIGGVEVAFVYPLSPVEHEFGSAEFFDHVRFAARRARELGLRFDLTLGSGWSYGGGHIGPDLAARRLHWDRREIGGAAAEVPAAPSWPADELVGAYLGAGASHEPKAYTELPIVNGTIRIPAGSGPREVLLAYARPTGQNVKRAAAGAEGPVLDHYSASAARAHIRAVAEPLLEAATPELVGSVFCDSLEVYAADWTRGAFDEFAKRRGYDLRPLLWLLAVDGDGAAELRRDFYRTLSELYEDNVLAVFRGWAASRGVPFRIQSYGEPPATLSSYRLADICEGEGWDWQGLPQTRWASSAAHLYGRDVVSAEVWTWVHSPSFRATPLDLKGEAHEHFLAGVNQLVGHGWPYSPSDAPGLGWFFYAAGALDDRNPWWPAAPELFGYLQRLSWLLRQGRPVRDVLIYVPAFDVYAGMGRAVGGRLDLWRGARQHIGPDIPRVVREAGLDFDLVDDDALTAGVLAPRAGGAAPGGAEPAEGAAVVVLPYVTAMPEATRRFLDDVMASGGVVLAVGSTTVPDGAVELADANELGEALARAGRADVSLVAEGGGVGVVHRRISDADVYFVANTIAERREVRFATASPSPWYEEWDARTGSVRRRGRVEDGIELRLDPYEATVLVLSAATTADANGTSRRPDRTSGRPVDGPWRVRYADGDESAPAEPVALPHRWEDDPDRAAYSGSATYDTEIHLDDAVLARPGVRIRLDFGECRELDGSGGSIVRGNSYRARVTPPIGVVAQVAVNGRTGGILWAPPYAVDITEHLRPGINTLTVTVSNTAANALAADPHIQAMVEEATRRYGLRFQMQDLNLSTATVASGLLATPTLTITRPAPDVRG